MSAPWGFSKEWRATRASVLKRDNYTCHYCGRYRKNERTYAGGFGNRVRYRSVLHADHVVPWSKGGTDGPDNLVTACVDCNLRKYDKQPESASAPLARGSHGASALLGLEVQRTSRPSAFVSDDVRATIRRSLEEAS